METKAILSANQARILPGQKQNIWIFGFGGENRIGLKRNNDHLSMRGPPPKVFFGKNHRLLPSYVVPHEKIPILRKRVYNPIHISHTTEDDAIRSVVPRKLPKLNISDDVEDMRQQFEQWEKDDCKENIVKKEKKQPGRRIWHIEAYIEQTVFESSTEA